MVSNSIVLLIQFVFLVELQFAQEQEFFKQAALISKKEREKVRVYVVQILF